MILATNAPSLPLCHHDDDDDEEGEDDTTKMQQEAPHAQVLRLLLRSVVGGPAARAALVDARNQNGKTGMCAHVYIRISVRWIQPVPTYKTTQKIALVMAIERRRPDLAAALLGAGADPYLMPAGVHHLLPLPLSPGVGTAADRAMAALLEVSLSWIWGACVLAYMYPTDRIRTTIPITTGRPPGPPAVGPPPAGAARGRRGARRGEGAGGAGARGGAAAAGERGAACYSAS